MVPNKINVEEEQSDKFKLNKTDMGKIGKSFLLSFAAFVITFLADFIPQIDYGQYSPMVYGIAPFILNFFRKLLTGK